MKIPYMGFCNVEKRLNRPSGEVIDGDNNQGTFDTQPTTNEVKTKGNIVIPYTQGFCKSITKSMGSMAYRPTSKIVAPSRTYWSPPRTKSPMVSKSGAIYWFQCGDLTCDDEYIGGTPVLLEKDSKST